LYETSQMAIRNVIIQCVITANPLGTSSAEMLALFADQSPFSTLFRLHKTIVALEKNKLVTMCIGK